MPRVKDILEIFLFFLLTFLLYLLFLSNLPFLWESQGGPPLSELADFSDRRLIPAVVFTSDVVCALLGSLIMEWVPSFTAATLAVYWGTTFLLLWIDGAPVYSMPSKPYFLLGIMGLGAFFLCLFFFTLTALYKAGILRKTAPKETTGLKANLVQYWLGIWMSFYFLVSVLLIFRSAGDFGPPQPLAMGFCAMSFLNFILLLRGPGTGKRARLFSIVGALYGLWTLFVIWSGWGWQWPH